MATKKNIARSRGAAERGRAIGRDPPTGSHTRGGVAPTSPGIGDSGAPRGSTARGNTAAKRDGARRRGAIHSGRATDSEARTSSRTRGGGAPKHRRHRSRESSRVRDSTATSKGGTRSKGAAEGGRAMGGEDNACPGQRREEGVRRFAKEVQGTALSSSDQQSAQGIPRGGTRE